MATAKRPENPTFKLVRPPSDVVFTDEVGRRDSVYRSKLLEAANSDQSIQVKRADKYVVMQLRTAAKKIKLRLVFGEVGEFLYIKPVRPTDQEDRLIKLLREPRTVDELKGKGLELHVEDTLNRMARLGTAHIHRGKWVLTEAGMDLLPKAVPAAV